jgi:K+-transporting ATPase ATPase C chain
MLIFTVILGIAYPLVMTGFAQVVFPYQANGSRVTNSSGQVVGSALIGQSFLDAGGHPLPQYFQPRPTAVGYTAAESGASNEGPEDQDLIATIQARRAEVAAFNGVPPAKVPVDAVTASGSGLDPDISPAYAAIQVARVAKARNMTTDAVAALVAKYTRGPDLGYLGESRVNVVKLNLALDER